MLGFRLYSCIISRTNYNYLPITRTRVYLMKQKQHQRFVLFTDRHVDMNNFYIFQTQNQEFFRPCELFDANKTFYCVVNKKILGGIQ